MGVERGTRMGVLIFCLISSSSSSTSFSSSHDSLVNVNKSEAN